MNFRINFDADFDEYEPSVEAKGWFDAHISADGAEIIISFYDPVRLAQEMGGALATRGLFFEKNLAVIPKVNRENMENALARISASFKPPL